MELNNNKIKAVLFDLDGTLIDSHSSYFNVWQNVLAQYGKNLTKQEFFSLTGLPYQKIISILLKEKKDILKNNDKLNEIYNKLFNQSLLSLPKQAKPMPFAKQAISVLKKSNLKIAIVSASPKSIIKECIEQVLLEKNTIDFFISNEDVVNNKPSPDCYLLAMNKFNLKSNNCVVVEDSPAGIVAGKSAEMKVLAVNSNFDLKLIKQAKPDYIFNNLNDVANQILNLAK